MKQGAIELGLTFFRTAAGQLNIERVLAVGCSVRSASAGTSMSGGTALYQALRMMGGLMGNPSNPS
jgi:hypothetical protein